MNKYTDPGTITYLIYILILRAWSSEAPNTSDLVALNDGAT